MDLASLEGALPAGAVSTDASALAEASLDWWPLAWLRAARGEAGAAPLAVVRPQGTAHVQAVLRWAGERGVRVLPRGGGSGVAGAASARGGDLVLDVRGLDRVLAVDEVSRTAVVQPGVLGDELERVLRERGLTVGHYPQSLGLSTVGGWIATTSAGHASYGFGGIEDRVLGLEAVSADGDLVRLRAVPRSAAGPDLRRWFVGAEGAFGVVTEVTLALSRAPSGYRWCAFALPAFDGALAVCRRIAQDGIPALVVRAYDEVDTALSFSAVGVGSGCALLVAFDADLPVLDWAVRATEGAAEEHDGRHLPDAVGEHWHAHHRDAIATFREVMGPERAWGPGTVVDTMEVAGLWRDVPGLHRSVRDALGAVTAGVGCHLSHLYPSGASLYFTFLVTAADDHAAEQRYTEAWAAAVAACHAGDGTMTHHHGVGRLKAPFLAAELGMGGLRMLRTAVEALDPEGTLRPAFLQADG